MRWHAPPLVPTKSVRMNMKLGACPEGIVRCVGNSNMCGFWNEKEGRCYQFQRYALDSIVCALEELTTAVKDTKDVIRNRSI